MTKFTVEFFPTGAPICFECDRSGPGARLKPAPSDGKEWLCFDCLKARIDSGVFTLSEGDIAEGFSRRGLVEHDLTRLTSNGTVCKDPRHAPPIALTKWALDGIATCFICIGRQIKAGDLHLVSLSPEVEAAIHPKPAVDISNLEVQW